MTDLEGAYESALNAEGSALKENEAYLDSIQGRIDLFNNSVQTMWMNFIDSEVVQFLVDVGTFLIKLVDNIGLIETALMGVVTYLTFIKKQDLSKSLFGGLIGGKNNQINLLDGEALDDEIALFNTALSQGAEAFGEYKAQAREAGNGMDILADKVEKGVIQTKNGKVAAEDYTVALQSQSSAATKAAKAEKTKSIAIGLSVMAISGIISAIQSYVDSLKTLEERYEELQSNISTVESDVSSLDSELEAIEEQIDALSNKNLTITEAEELRKLKEQSAELQKQKELRENTLSVYNKQNEIASLEMFNQKLRETAAGQEHAKETAKAWATALGTVLDIALVAGGVVVTGLSGGLATAAGAAMMGAGMSGAATSLTGMAAEQWGGASKSVGEDLTAWYDSYINAIAEADKQAAEAESKYLSNISDANYEAWQNKLDESNTLKEELYNNLEEMQGYINNLEYNDTTASTIDGFNKLIAQINVKSLDGDIEAQISSIESLKSEFAELSKGVDEHGNNIALSADEYSRYNAIVEQVLAYQTGLTKGYDENGNSILRAADGQYTYNQLLAQSIELMKQQQQEAAKDATNDENIIKSYESIIENSKKSIDSIDWSDRPNALSVDAFKNPHGWLGGANWGTDDIAETISGVIGVDFSLTFGDHQGFIYDNIRSIQENRDAITEKLTNELTSMGFSDDVVKAYVDQTNTWLDNITGQIFEVMDTAKAQFKKELAVVPQGSDYYYDLDGTSLAFINDYISAYVDGIENIENLSDEEVTAIRDNIANLTNTIGNSKVAQDLINNLFDVDANLPVQNYRDAINKILDQLVTEGIIDDGTKIKMFNQLVPDDENLDMMLQTVKAKLKDGLGSFADTLSISDLKIAYRYSIEAADGSLTIEDLKEYIDSMKSQDFNGEIIKTYSSLIEEIESYNDVLNQTSEIITDNIQVTQEYKDALVALGVSEEDLNECFHENNKLVVKDAKALNNLVRAAKKNTAQNIKLAKSQARLEYYELYKKMRELTKGQGQLTGAALDEVNALYDQMSALQKSAARYSLLESKLLGAANAYERLAEAQEIDAENDYGSKAEELVNVLAEAFNTSELGTEAAQVAVEGLIPESVFEDADTLDEKMQRIYDYFTKGKVSQLFTIEFDDEGGISSVEMTKENIEAFTKQLTETSLGDGLGTIFQGSWDEFTLNPAITSLEQFAEACGVTEEVAFAFLTSLEKYDISWLGGDMSTLIDQLMGDSLEYSINRNTQKLAELEVQYANGKISAEEYQKSLYGLKGQLSSGAITQEQYNAAVADLETQLANGTITAQQYNEAIVGLGGRSEELADRARKETKAWYEKSEQLEENKKKLEEYYEQLESGKDSSGNVIDPKKVKENIETVTKEIDTLNKELGELEEPTEVKLQVAKDDIQKDLNAIEKEIGDLVEGKHYQFNIETGKYEVIWDENDPNYQKIVEFVALLNEEHTIDTKMGTNTPTVTEQLQDIAGILENIAKLLQTEYGLTINTDGEVDKINEVKTAINEIPANKTVTVTIEEMAQNAPSYAAVSGYKSTKQYTKYANGTVHANGSAFAGGSFGAPKTETALVGELGPEMIVRNGRWTTVGENGAEFAQVKKGDIIFNHKQTEELLSNGYVTSRGKAYASGTAYANTRLAEVRAFGSSIKTWDKAYQNVYNDYSNAIIADEVNTINEETTNEGTSSDTYTGTNNLADDYSNTGEDNDDTEDIFEETFDWIEVRLEEWDETLGKLNAQLENAVYYTEKNNKINEIIAANQGKLVDIQAGADYYEKYAQKYLDQLDGTYRTYAQNGAIAIEDFIGDADEATVEAIQNYREYIQKAADLNQQAEEVLAEIRDLAIKRVDNAYEHGDVRAAVENSQTEKLQNAVDYDEARGLITDPNYYSAMMENSSKEIEYWTTARNAMQEEFDRAVQNGEITRGSNEWYETLDKLYQVDAEIAAATIELEEFQNAINDIYWDSFDETINRFDYLSEETQGLIDLMDSADMVSKPDDENGWGASDVTWTAEGLATLGLHAQEMERAEEKAKMYAQAIDDLTADYEAGHYSESEYYEKLNELTQGQYDAIEAAQDEKDAIVELNEQRVDAIKEGIEKEIDAYSELIEKKKEELDAEKDLFDFQKSTMEQQKNISDIERQLAALANDNSMSAAAKRKQLEAELAEAKADLEDSYYNRSVDNQQEALDKELEGFQEEKEAEIEQLDQWLTNVEGVVAESLGIVQTNAAEIGKTLTDKASEYNLTVSDAVLNPWKDGMGAIDDYTTKIGDSVSPTTEALEPIRAKWQEIKEELQAANKEADKYYDKNDATADGPSVAAINAENAKYAEAKPKQAAPKQEAPKQETPKQKAPSLTSGSSIVVKKSATHYGSKSGNAKMASFVPGGTYTVYQTSGDQVLIGLNGVYTGWIKKADIEGFAKGTTGVKKNQLALIDELGDELVMHAGPNGRLQYLTKGSSVIPHDISENLMKLGQLDPSEILSRSAPQIAPSKSIINTTMEINMNIAEVVHIDTVSNDTLPDLTKAVRKEMDSYMFKVNNAIKSKVR